MENASNYDAEFCGKVSLHQTNLIQPHSLLLILIRDDLFILQASENCDAVFGFQAPVLVREKPTTFTRLKSAALLHSTNSVATLDKRPIQFHIGGKNFLALVKPQETYFILETEKDGQFQKFFD